MASPLDLQKYFDMLDRTDPIRSFGRIAQVIGLVMESQGPRVSVGDLCFVENTRRHTSIPVEVVGLRNDRVLLMPLEEMHGVGIGSRVVSSGKPITVQVGDDLLGRTIDPLGRPLDGKGPLASMEERSLLNAPPNPMTRARIEKPLSTGVRAIDGTLTCGRGQRIGIFAGSGVGKSTLMGMIARNTEADVNVIALIGERGREVRDFIDKDLKEDGLKRSVIIAVTSEKSALMRYKGVLTASTIAEYFRDKGLNVVLMMDSVTRFALASREIGLAIGEPPTTKGYPPSVFAALPKVLERSGNSEHGNITGFYTVLVEGDDMNDPIADAVRSILDGHIVLSRAIASQNHYPAIDVLESISRLMPDVTTPEHRMLAGKLRDILSTYREAADLINIGAYVDGSNPKIDYAKKMIDRVNGYLRQNVEERVTLAGGIAELERIFAQ